MAKKAIAFKFQTYSFTLKKSSRLLRCINIAKDYLQYPVTGKIP